MWWKNNNLRALFQKTSRENTLLVTGWGAATFFSLQLWLYKKKPDSPTPGSREPFIGFLLALIRFTGSGSLFFYQLRLQLPNKHFLISTHNIFCLITFRLCNIKSDSRKMLSVLLNSKLVLIQMLSRKTFWDHYCTKYSKT